MPRRLPRWQTWAIRALVATAALAASDRLAGFLLARYRPELFFRQDLSEIRLQARQTARRPFLQPDWDRPASARDEAVVGIFGGSVAYSLADSLIIDGGSWRYRDELSRRLGRPVRFLNLALSGGAQPQQFNLLHLSAHRIAAAIFLDGFNEQFAQNTDCEQLTTFWAHERATPSEVLRPLADATHSFDRGLSLLDLGVFEHSGVFRLALFNRSLRLNQVATTFFTDLDREGLRRDPPGPPPLFLANEHWAGCVRRSYEFARARHLPAFFFVQPNQHVAHSKPMAPSELACCMEVPAGQLGPLAGVYGSLTERYADLGAHVERLQREGVPVHSLADIFRATPEPVYVDWCCHLNTHGSQLVAEEIFRTMTLGLSLPAAPTDVQTSGR